MRDIRFRGFGKHVKRWHYGYFWVAPYGSCFIKEDGEDLEVDKEFVGQFTGLIDKNDRGIYEKDVVRWNNQNWIVEYYSHGFCLMPLQTRPLMNSQWQEMEMEVIGNVFENAELLKESK